MRGLGDKLCSIEPISIKETLKLKAAFDEPWEKARPFDLDTDFWQVK
jgi:hypothetical protein